MKFNFLLLLCLIAFAAIYIILEGIINTKCSIFCVELRFLHLVLLHLNGSSSMPNPNASLNPMTAIFVSQITSWFAIRLRLSCINRNMWKKIEKYWIWIKTPTKLGDFGHHIWFITVTVWHRDDFGCIKLE